MERVMDYPCNNPVTIYKNETSATRDVGVVVTDRCGGNSEVYVVNPDNGDVSDRTLFSPPGGTVTFSVTPGMRSIYFVTGGGDDSQNLCNVELSEPD